jgi:hypothetical protein
VSTTRKQKLTKAEYVDLWKELFALAMAWEDRHDMDPNDTSRLLLQVGTFLAKEMDISIDQVIEYVRGTYSIGRPT